LKINFKIFPSLKYTLDSAKKVFGFDSLMVGDAHKSLSKALMACKQFENDFFLEHAQEAYKIASAYYNLDNPKLMSYQTTLGVFFCEISYLNL
jgi:hypothetical protein